MATAAGNLANVLMGVGLILWVAGETIGIVRHTREKDTSSEWVRAFRVKVGRLTLSVLLTVLYLVLLVHFDWNVP